MSINMVKIRATINIGDALSVSTPYVLSFNVAKARGQLSSFSASVKVKHSTVGGAFTGNGITIAAGEGSPHLIFTGIIKSANITPC